MEALLADPVSATLVAGLLGLLVGSFLNVVILRLPRRLEWEWKRDARELLELPEAYEPAPPGIVVESSHCPHCGHKLAAWENIPLLSYLALRGKCRACGARISWQYPFVEALTGLLFAACIWKFGADLDGGLALFFTATLVALAGIDLRTTLLPDALTQPLLWVGLLASLVPAFVDPMQALLGAAAGYLSLWSVYWLFKLVTGKEGMGEGDFKLLAALGAWCGWQAIFGIVLLSSAVGAVIGGAWLLLKGRDSSTQIPFGPYLAIAGWLEFYYRFDVLSLVMRLTAPHA
jgi:leader peptidase (prepilin peptidase) / N-methyltransferase